MSRVGSVLTVPEAPRKEPGVILLSLDFDPGSGCQYTRMFQAYLEMYLSDGP